MSGRIDQSGVPGDGVGPTGGERPGSVPAARHRRPPAGLVGTSTSLLVHLLILALAALITFSRGGGGEGLHQDGSVQFAVISEQELAALEDAALALDSPSAPELEATDLPAVDSLMSDLEVELSGLMEAAELQAELGGGDISGTDLGLEGAGGGGSSFFGIEATGSRFVYIVDISGSMSIGGRIEALRDELTTAIEGLSGSSRFFVCLFNHEAVALGRRNDWVEASRSGKRWAVERIGREVVPGGGTVPQPAFQLVFERLRPPPDAIYFMTDGEFAEIAVVEIRRMNTRRVPIHCITFGDRSGERLMRQIAKENDGTYVHVPGPGG
jgi:hypothetical protein